MVILSFFFLFLTMAVILLFNKWSEIVLANLILGLERNISVKLF